MKIELFNPAEQVKALSEMEFCDLAAFNEGGAGVFWSSEGGPSPWEMHPDCDELLHIMEGEVEVEVLPPSGGEPAFATLKAGWYLVVPRGCWHRQTIIAKSRELYLTPGATLHSEAVDPRVEG